jgi:hypothetical protein
MTAFQLLQYIFPASKRSIDPRSGVERRHHLDLSALPKAVRRAIRWAGINKRAGWPSYGLWRGQVIMGYLTILESKKK